MQSVLSFYQKIYEQELAQAKLLHLHSSKVLKRYFVSKKEELLNEEYPHIPISDKKGEEIIKTLALKSNEIRLKYFSMARISRFKSLKKHETVRVYPLFSFDATVEIKDGAYYLHIDLKSKRFIRNNLPQKIAQSEAFQKLNTAPLLDFHFASKLHEIISKKLPEAIPDELLLFPEIWSKRKLNKVLKEEFQVGETYIPLGVLAILEKENNSFTTLHELEEITENQAPSLPLQALFGTIPNYSEEKRGIICEELNKSQFDAIENSNEKIVSVISGPPGTGKSFTIANLIAEKVSKGKSILVTSKNKEALNVIEEKIKDQLSLDNLCVNPSQDQSFSWMKSHLDYVLGRSYRKENFTIADVESTFSTYQKMYDHYLNAEKELMDKFKLERDYVMNLNDKLSKETGKAFKDRIYKHRSKTNVPLWKSLDKYYASNSNIRKKAINNLRLVNTFMLEESIKNSRYDLRNYLSFLRARELERKEKLAKLFSYDPVLKAFPVWLIKANDISRVLPLKREAFDLLIIDEASQCDIPSIIPLMQRAKKVVIVGDTKQLTHISFITNAFEYSCKMQVEEDFQPYCQHRGYSTLHLAQEFLDPLDCVQLNEHFRSQFPIIAFSNNQFYQDRLDILTKRPISVASHVQFIRTEGMRTKGHHETEADLIIEKILSIIKDEHHLPNHLKTSIGVLSPFRKQVDYLFNQISKKLTFKEIKKHKIIVGTAFTFQGNERETMLISLNLDHKSLSGSFTFLNRKDVFNVSITRARNTQIIYYSFDPSTLKMDSTLSHFFRFYNGSLKDDVGRSTKDEFCLEIVEILHQQNIQTWTNFTISGVSIDLLAKHNTDFIGIDLIGFPGEMEDYYSLERYKMIQRGKVRLFPLTYTMWRGQREKCIEAIKALFIEHITE